MSKSKVVADLPITKAELLNPEHLLLELNISAYSNLAILPGQFVQVQSSPSLETFLRVPLSIHDVSDNTMSLLVKLIGDGTQSLKKLKIGDTLNVLFPLGNSFTIPTTKEKPILLVGGGCGVAPLLFLAKYLIKEGFDLSIAIGASNEKNIVRLDQYQTIAPTEVASDDGSIGKKGLVVELPVFSRINEFQAIYTCGPDGMMKAVSEIAQKNGVYCEVSLENYMACGIGACLCCVAATDKGNLRTCVEGPVFDASTLKNWTKTVCNG